MYFNTTNSGDNSVSSEIRYLSESV
jgi:hypothetical protein